MPTWTRDLDELQRALSAAGRSCAVKNDQLVCSVTTVTGRARDVILRRTADVLELSVALARVAPGREAGFDQAMADVDRRLAFPGLRRAEDGTAAFVMRLWLNHDGSLDAQVAADALATAQHVLDNYEPSLSAAARGEAAHG